MSLNRMYLKDSASKGFTLIELLIVVVILGILLAIALPAYQDRVREGNRADAHAALADVGQRMQRCYTVNNDYTGCVSNHDSPDGHYSITVDVTNSGNEFTAQASAQSSIQAGDVAACKTLELDHRGERGPQAAVNANCW